MTRRMAFDDGPVQRVAPSGLWRLWAGEITLLVAGLSAFLPPALLFGMMIRDERALLLLAAVLVALSAGLLVLVRVWRVAPLLWSGRDRGFGAAPAETYRRQNPISPTHLLLRAADTPIWGWSVAAMLTSAPGVLAGMALLRGVKLAGPLPISMADRLSLALLLWAAVTWLVSIRADRAMLRARGERVILRLYLLPFVAVDVGIRWAVWAAAFVALLRIAVAPR